MEKKLLWALIGITAVSLIINVKFALAASSAKDKIEGIQNDPVGFFKGLVGMK